MLLLGRGGHGGQTILVLPVMAGVVLAVVGSFRLLRLHKTSPVASKIRWARIAAPGPMGASAPRREYAPKSSQNIWCGMD